MNKTLPKSKLITSGTIPVLTVGAISFTLMPCTSSELKMLRNQKKPYFVYKNEDQLFYCILKKEQTIAESLGHSHKCNSCHRLYALPDPEGCEKIRALPMCLGIEKYDFIERGFEIFGTTHPRFVVWKCKNQCSQKKEAVHPPFGI